jgi:hypothetical protein
MNGKRTLTSDRRRRRLKTLGWSLGLLLVVVLLIAFEKTAILYILATLGVSALLFVVGKANLSRMDGGATQPSSENRDASVIASSSK